VDALEPVKRFDRWQQRHRPVAFVLATNKKYSDDEGGHLAAIIAYYAFFSIFPLLLVFTTILGYVLDGHPGAQRAVVGSALGQFPVIGDQLQTGRLTGSAIALAVGAAGALWAGMGVFLAAESAMNRIWGVPYTRRPDFVRQRLRALRLLAVLGGGVLATSILAGLGTFGARYGILWKIGSLALSTGLNFLLFWVAFRFLTSSDVTWRCLRGGAIAAAVGYEILQGAGGYYVGHVLKDASNTYGTFALVIGLLTWIYLAAHVMLLAAEGNVVATRHLYPRSLLAEGEPTDADRRALRQRAKVEKRHAGEEIEVGFGRNRRPGP
jgi:YihY family inner membrane protein